MLWAVAAAAAAPVDGIARLFDPEAFHSSARGGTGCSAFCSPFLYYVLTRPPHLGGVAGTGF